jgi:hypothetical protein
MESWIEIEQKRLAIENAGRKEYFKFPKGETEFTINTTISPTEENGKFGIRKIFQIQVKGKEYLWSTNPKNPTYREIINKMANGQTVFRMLKSGEAKDTKYELL